MESFMKNTQTLVVLVLAAFLTGCAGYQIGSPKPKALEGIRSISVPTAQNKTLKPRVEVLAANAVIKQLQQDGTYTVAPTGSADAELELTVLRIDRAAARSVRGNVRATREFRLSVELGYALSDSFGNQLAGGSVTGSTTFFVGDDVNEEERIGIPRALENAAVRLVSELSEGW